MRVALEKEEGAPAGAPSPLKRDLSLTQNAIDRGAADRALALCHTTARVGNVHSPFELTLLFALYAVGLALICLCHSIPPIHAGFRHPANTPTIPA